MCEFVKDVSVFVKCENENVMWNVEDSVYCDDVSEVLFYVENGVEKVECFEEFKSEWEKWEMVNKNSEYVVEVEVGDVVYEVCRIMKCSEEESVKFVEWFVNDYFLRE